MAFAVWQRVVSFVVISLLFAMSFKILRDVKIAWRDVWLGAIVTAALFTIGKLAIGMYLGKSSVSSSFGAAGSPAVVLLWAYYSPQILFLGAEFTKVYAGTRGSGARPAKDAVPMRQECDSGERRARGAAKSVA